MQIKPPLRTQVVSKQACHAIPRKEINSVGCADWERRVAEAHDGSTRISLFQFGTDAGGENVGFAFRMRRAVPQDVLGVQWISMWCMMHQGQLCIKAVLGFLDSWSWGEYKREVPNDVLVEETSSSEDSEADEDDDDSEDDVAIVNASEGGKMPTTYVNGVSAISNAWRMTGNPRLVHAAASALHGPDVAEGYFARAPGRVLRTRWLSIESVETLIFNGLLFIASVFSHVWGQLLARGQRRRRGRGGRGRGRGRRRNRGLQRDEDEAFQKMCRRWKVLATTLVSLWKFRVMLTVSLISKGPLIHFMLWMQKARREHSLLVHAATSSGRSYLGPTPLSRLIAGQGQEFETAMNELLMLHPQDRGSLFHPAALLVGGVGEPATDDERSVKDFYTADLLRLIVALVLLMIAQWQMRFNRRIFETWPFLLFLFLEAEPDVEDDRRARLAAEYRRLSKEELLKAYPWTDMHFKTKELFAAELRSVETNNGRCPANLYFFISLCRARMPYETQEVEGFNSIIKSMTQAAPRMELPLASDRLRNKVCDDILPSECVELHGDVEQHMRRPEYLQRFMVPRLPVPDEQQLYFLDRHLVQLSRRYGYDGSNLTTAKHKLEKRF